MKGQNKNLNLKIFSLKKPKMKNLEKELWPGLSKLNSKFSARGPKSTKKNTEKTLSSNFKE